MSRPRRTGIFFVCTSWSLVAGLVVKIHVADIKSEGLEKSFLLSRDELEGVLDDPKGEISGAEGGLSVEARLDRLDETIFVKGEIVANVGFICVRCTAEKVVRLDVDLNAVLMPRPGAEGHPFDDDEDGVELSAEDLDVTFYGGTEIDLKDIVREAIYLNMPDYPTCGAEPKDCTDWEANIATVAREMEENKTDLRWDALKAIKARMADQDKN